MLRKTGHLLHELLYILRYRRLGLNTALIIITFAASYYYHPLAPLFFILTSTLFDILGYHFTLIRKGNTLPEKDIVKSYRIIQIMFDIVLLLLIGLLFGWISALCGAILKWFGLQDLLYYFFLNEKLPAIWNWMGFTPLGLFKDSLTYKEVIFQTAIGVIISIFIIAVI